MSTFELGGFAEYPEDIDGNEFEYEAFNRCLAEEYVTAMYNEDFESLGIMSADLFDTICQWTNNTKLIEEIKNGTLMTINNRTFIDAIYANKIMNIAETYTSMGVHDPKLILTIILGEDEDELYNAYIGNYKTEEYDKVFKSLYDLIEEEFLQAEEKDVFLQKIKRNYSRIRTQNNYQSKVVPDTYLWVKCLKENKPIIAIIGNRKRELQTLREYIAKNISEEIIIVPQEQKFEERIKEINVKTPELYIPKHEIIIEEKIRKNTKGYIASQKYVSKCNKNYTLKYPKRR